MSLAKRCLKIILNISKFTKAGCVHFLRTRWTRRVHINETAVHMNKKLCNANNYGSWTLRVHIQAFCSNGSKILYSKLWKRSVTHYGLASWVILYYWMQNASSALFSGPRKCVCVLSSSAIESMIQYLGLIVVVHTSMYISSMNVIRLELTLNDNWMQWSVSLFKSTQWINWRFSSAVQVSVGEESATLLLFDTAGQVSILSESMALIVLPLTILWLLKILQNFVMLEFRLYFENTFSVSTHAASQIRVNSPIRANARTISVQMQNLSAADSVDADVNFWFGGTFRWHDSSSACSVHSISKSEDCLNFVGISWQEQF